MYVKMPTQSLNSSMLIEILLFGVSEDKEQRRILVMKLSQARSPTAPTPNTRQRMWISHNYGLLLSGAPMMRERERERYIYIYVYIYIYLYIFLCIRRATM